MRPRENERGSTLVIVALFATALSLFTVLGANVGLMVYQRTKLQAAADASALAGAWALDFGDDQARAAAKQYALSNGYTLEDADLTVENSSRVRVKLSQPVDLLLGDFLSKKTMTVGAASTAQFELISRGLRPLAMPDPLRDKTNPKDFTFDTPYLIKEGAGGAIGGNFGALAMSSSGASVFEDNFKYGADLAYQISDKVPTETGNMYGATEQAVEWLIAKNPNGSYAQAQQNPKRDPRVITVVLVDPQEFANLNGKSDVTVTGFAQFWLDYDPQNKGEVKAYYIGRVANQQEMPGTEYHAKLQLVL